MGIPNELTEIEEEREVNRLSTVAAIKWQSAREWWILLCSWWYYWEGSLENALLMDKVVAVDAGRKESKSKRLYARCKIRNCVSSS